jgi:enolase
MSTIHAVKARRLFNSRGTPTIEIEVLTEGRGGRALAPSGASTGIHEVVAYPHGGVEQAVHLVEEVVAPKLVGVPLDDLKTIDALLHELDGTADFRVLGGNTALAISLATAKAAAASRGIALFRTMGQPSTHRLPHPLGNVLGGGKHAGRNAPDVQEFLVLPVQVASFTEAAQANIRIHAEVGARLEKVDPTFTGGKGDEGAWAPNLRNDEALAVVVAACEVVSKERGVDVRPGLDVAASSLWDERKALYAYPREGVERDTGDQIEYIAALIETYGLVYVEDPLHEDDFDGFAELTKRVKHCLICGDDLFTTNTERLTRGIDQGAGNSIIIKPNQIGTLTDTRRAVELAVNAGYVPIASHRSGETCDPYLAHLAVGMDCPVIKVGVLGGERVAKVNELIRIEEALAERSAIAELNI